MYKIIMAFSVVISSFSANAAFIFGNELYQLCTSDENSQFYFQDESECRGYVTGVYDRLTGTAKNGVLCLEGKITTGQVKKIFIAYADKNPAKLNRSAYEVDESSIYQAFRCSK